MTHPWTVDRSRAFMVHPGKVSTKYGVFVYSHGSCSSSLHSCVKAILAKNRSCLKAIVAKNHGAFSPNVISKKYARIKQELISVFIKDS